MCAVIQVTTSACTVHQNDAAPPLAGPSTFAQSVAVAALPDRISQDGQSQSSIIVRVYGANGQPANAVPLRLDVLVNDANGKLVVADYGTLSTKSIVTGIDGRATSVYRSPPPPPFPAQSESTVTIRATPVGTDARSSPSFSAEIRLVPPGVILPPGETPTADFVVTPTPVNLNVAAIFDASSSCGDAITSGRCSGSRTITSYAWTFGDGSSGSGKTVLHTFAAIGTFNATLTVTNDYGLAASQTQAITVSATVAPTASFVFSPIAPQIGQPVVFNSDASRAAPGRTIAGYTWAFGDGASAGGASPTHAFTSAGTYNVVLTIVDDAGQKGTISQPVAVGIGSPPGSSAVAAVFSPASLIESDGLRQR
jgi:PKD repeat protein